MRKAKSTLGVPTVFISSTIEDLKPHYRYAARDAAIEAGFYPIMQEYFVASGEHPPLPACLQKLTNADVIVVIVAHRYGWKPPDQPPGPRKKSITWLECEYAREQTKEVLAFVVDDPEWPEPKKDTYRITEAIKERRATPELLAEVQEDVDRLEEFKSWLNALGIRSTFTGPDDLRGKVMSALRNWRDRVLGVGYVASQKPSDATRYLEQLREQCSWIDIQGLQVGTGKAHRFPIEDLYIPLTMAAAPDRERAEVAERRSVLLEEALAHRRLVIMGDPGSGKTTFFRHIALERIREVERGRDGDFPILIRVAELLEHISRRQNSRLAADSPAWILDFMASRSLEFNQGLDERFFREKCENGPAILMLDGLDEAPNTRQREAAVRLFENTTRAFPKCRVVVTTRPLSYAGRSVLAGFETVAIEPLETSAIETFLEHWCTALFPESSGLAKRHLAGLAEALRSVPEIHRMARNPVMLTALAVVHWNERRLPQQRADLYESILIWLARAREMREGRESADRCLQLLQQLALAMQTAPGGRRVQMEKGEASEALACCFPSRADALGFLEQEEVDSGIIVSRGAELQFWHLTFQEYLAARAIGGMEEPDQRTLLLHGDAIYRTEWREMVLLLAGVLCGRQGPGKVNGLFRAVLDQLKADGPLAAKAKCAGLLGAMVSDLKPLRYEPADPRYRNLMAAVLGIFDAQQACQIDFKVRLEAAEALGQAGDPRLGENNWIRIEGKDGLETFEIGKFPVTVAEYCRFVEDGGYTERRWWNPGGFGQRSEPDEWETQKEYPNRPVTGVNWFEASAYAAWAGARLLTRAEWEWAALGKQRREYPWGNKEPDATRANYTETGPRQVTPVGLYPCGATPEGVEDMAGNVWEWTSSRYEPGEYKVLRGGSWNNDASLLRVSDNFNYPPVYRYNFIGFRVAREVVP
jgi:Sulfatase-modifying factor enzyme 1/Domain of unknown function (DUF4062)/NACHT domain